MVSTIKGGTELVDRLYKEHAYFDQDMVDLKHRDVVRIRDTISLAAHRLAWLEAVTLGLSYQAQHDASAYAKFVLMKRNIEDMDIEELRVLLRDR